MSAATRRQAMDLPEKHPAMLLLADVAQRYKTSVEELRSPARHAHLVAARAEAYAVLKSRRWSCVRIGALFNRDDTTVGHALERRAALEAREVAHG